MFRRHVRARLRLLFSRARRFVLLHVLHADDPPHRLALGCAIGMFVTFTPTVGAQMILTVFLAWLLGGNKVVGLPVVWISNPATIVPIYYLCFLVGQTLLGHEPVGETWWRELANPPVSWWAGTKFYWERLMQIAVPLWIGGCVVGFVFAYPTYYATYHAICAYRLRRWGQLLPPGRER